MHVPQDGARYGYIDRILSLGAGTGTYNAF